MTALAAVKGAAAGGSTLTLIKGALKIMAWTKAKTAVVAAVVLILAAGTTTVVIKNSGYPSGVKSRPDPATQGSFQRESKVRAQQAKLWALACIMFASDHGDQLPKDFDQSRTYGPGLSDANWEIVSGGDEKGIVNPSKTILLREKESRQSPGGEFAKIYAFADGHVQLISSPDKDFAALEKQSGFLVHPVKN